jgi:hypothetical protein
VQKQVIAWKNQYEDVYYLDLCDIEFVFREITKAEFEKARRYYPDEEEREEYVCKECVIYPADFDYANCYAGIPFTLCRAILRESCYIDGMGKLVLDQFRVEMEDFEQQIAPIICTAFPKFDLEEVESWTIRKQLRYLTRAEWALSNVHCLPFAIAEEQSEQPDYDAFPELRKEQQVMKRLYGRS